MHFSYNQRKLIGLLMTDGPQSRTILAQKLQLTKAAVTIMTQPLIEEGFVVELGAVDSGKVGRKETLVDLGDNKYVAIGVDVRQNCVNVSFTNLRGTLQHFQKFSTFKAAIDHIKQAMNSLNIVHEIAILLRGYKGLPSFDHNVELVEHVMNEVNLPYRIVHNVSALAILHKFYFPSDLNYLVVKYGPGVGSAIMTSGQLLSNDLHVMSEIGHMLVDHQLSQTLEEQISYDVIAPGVDESDVIELILSSADTLDSIMSKLAYCIVNAHALLALDKIVIAGLLFVSDEAFECLRMHLQQYHHILKHVNLVRIDEYKEKEKKIGSLVALYYHFLNL